VDGSQEITTFWQKIFNFSAIEWIRRGADYMKNSNLKQKQ